MAPGSAGEFSKQPGRCRRTNTCLMLGMSFQVDPRPVKIPTTAIPAAPLMASGMKSGLARFKCSREVQLSVSFRAGTQYVLAYLSAGRHISLVGLTEHSTLQVPRLQVGPSFHGYVVTNQLLSQLTRTTTVAPKLLRDKLGRLDESWWA